ncbi:two-component regulator propeller domain-containing protein [uncultured Polaribacter sp.]|uniref:ligand-binding sensor domain-containing protein n=1 Tax=uncultured Polaribacter sp. TaxID=174711 RepID=UPI002619C543|nr:two-component regulator propeller domain-containing protein [uncultured Polaribacter sp.]
MSTQSITYAIKEDNLGNLWIGSEEGILKHNSKYYRVYNTYNGLPESLSNRASEIFIDSNNNIWAGLEKGVCKYNKNLDKFELIQTADNINPSLVNSISEDSNSNIWIGGFNGLWKYNPTNKNLEKTTINDAIDVIFIYKNYVLCGTKKGLYIYNIDNKKTSKINLPASTAKIYYINTAFNAIYLGTQAGELLEIDTTTFNYKRTLKNFNHTIRDILQDKKNLYIATDGNGIYQLNNKLEIITHFKEDSNNPTSISSNGIYDLEISKEGILWAATYGGGINYYNINRLPFLKVQHKLNNKNSISSNFTRSIANDKNGNVWFGTKKGLSIWNRKKNSWKHLENFKTKNNTPVIVLALEADNNYMWVGTYNYGLFKIDIKSF